MAQLPLDLDDLSRRLVKQEASGSLDPTAAATGMETVCRRLRDDLKDILGSGGVFALMRRALTLAMREHPLLVGVAVDTGPMACFTGLAEALAAGTDEEAAAAAAAVLAHLLGLLVTLLGEELGLQPVRKFWPHVALSVREIDE